MTLSAGDRLGPFEVLSPLGKGGMGEVYRARDTKLNRDVALKVLPATFASDRERLARFDREAQVLASLNHPAIAHIHGLEDSSGIRAIVMELVEGPTLADKLQRGSIGLSAAIRIARQIAEALEAAHDRGIVHRDLKPANIKVSEDDTTVKVLDFGLASIAKSDGDGIGSSEALTRMSGVTEAGLILGTPAYMSPEQARGQAVDKRTDIWAFGVVLFEMLSGQPAYGGATTTDIIAGIVSRDPDWNRLPTETPADVRQLLARCLEKDPLRRLRDIGEARVSLTDASIRQPVARGRRGWWAALLALVVVVGLVTFGFSRLGRDQNSSTVETSGPARLVVLPFENLSKQPSDDWLSGAFSDSLTLGLQGLENVVLVNRERLRELESGLADQQAAKVLGTRYYVSGTFQRVGEDIRVVARLFETRDGAIKHQGEPITDRFANLLQIEDQLAHRFAASLQQSAAITTRAMPSSMSAYQAVAQANDLYLDGRYPEAVEKLEKATREDERYSDAWALLGKSYAQLRAPSNANLDTRVELQGRALNASLRAIELDPSLYEGQVALAITYQQLENVEAWKKAAQKAIDMNPRLAEAYVILGDAFGTSPAFGCSRKRDVEQAVGYYRKALDLNPSFGAAHGRMATSLSWAGREPEALEVAKNAIQVLPRNLQINRTLAGAYLWTTNADELEKQLEKIRGMSAPIILDNWMWGVVDLLRGRTDKAAATFQSVIDTGPAILREIDTARIYAMVGRMTETVQHLEHAFALDPGCATFVSQSGAFAPYRNDPAVRDLLTRYTKTR